MDLIYRKEKYNAYLKRLHQIKGDMDEESQLKEIRDGINVTLTELRNKSDVKDNTILYAILLLPLVITLIWQNIEGGGLGASFMPLIMVLIFFFCAHVIMKKVITDNTELKWNSEITDENQNAFLIYKIQYLKSALKIKEMRSILIQVFYMLFFPILLFFLYQLGFQSIPFNSTLTGLGIAYLIGSSFWYFYFQKERYQLNRTNEIIEEYENFINLPQ